MPNHLEPKSSPPPEEESPQTAPQAEVQILPAAIFFAEILELPEPLESEEIDLLVELEIEQVSPFPVEQLIWGWVRIEEGQKVLIYATTEEKAKAAGVSEFDNPQQALVAPFAACTRPTVGTANVIFHSHHNDAVAVSYDDSGQPIEIESISLTESATEDDFALHARELLSQGSSTSCRHVYLGMPEQDNDSGLSWPLYTTSSYSSETTPDSTSELDSTHAWYADLRDRAFKEQRQQELKQSGRLWKALSVIAIIAIVMLCLEIVQWSTRGYLDFQAATLAQQAPLVDRLDQQQTFLHKMEDIEQSQMRPFGVLAILNENRPDNITVLRAEAIDSTHYELQAEGTAVNEVNNYVASYQGNPAFSEVKHDIRRSNSGKVIFDLVVTVGQMPEITGLEPVAEETDETEENEEEGS